MAGGGLSWDEFPSSLRVARRQRAPGAGASSSNQPLMGALCKEQDRRGRSAAPPSSAFLPAPLSPKAFGFINVC